jgi:hypothetical protein
MKYILVIGGLIIFMLFGYFVQWSPLVLVLLTVLFFIIALIGFIIKLIKKSKSKWWLYPLYLMLFSIIGLAVTFIKPLEELNSSNVKLPNKHLEYLYTTDQADRQNLLKPLLIKSYRAKMMKRDSIRLRVVLNYINRDSVSLSPKGNFYAAMILQHGKKPNHYKLAHELALEAAKHDVQNAEWLSKATYDRWMLSIGKPQKYNTQNQTGSEH